MTRDEILEAIREATKLDPMDTGLDEIHLHMRSVVALADQYPDHADGHSLAEALSSAVDSFADILQRYI